MQDISFIDSAALYNVVHVETIAKNRNNFIIYDFTDSYDEKWYNTIKMNSEPIIQFLSNPDNKTKNAEELA